MDREREEGGGREQGRRMNKKNMEVELKEGTL